MTSMSKSILLTKKWLSEIVIGFGLCPFASYVYNEGHIVFSSIKFSFDTLLDEMNSSIQLILDDSNTTSTKLIVIDDGLEEFNDYLDVFYALEEELKRSGLNSDVQLANFHPQYMFKDSQPSDVANYTNRSPYPIFHILKVADVTAAIESHPHIHDIAPNNIKLLEQKGIQVIKQLWRDKGFIS